MQNTKKCVKFVLGSERDMISAAIAKILQQHFTSHGENSERKHTGNTDRALGPTALMHANEYNRLVD